MQGDVLSPWLFIIALARIRELSAEILLKLQGGERGGGQMGDVIVEELAYADDDAKVDDTVQAAQEKLDVVDKSCHRTKRSSTRRNTDVDGAVNSLAQRGDLVFTPGRARSGQGTGDRTPSPPKLHSG